MIAGGGKAPVLEQLAHGLHIFPGGAVDNAALFPLLFDKFQEPGVFVPGANHAEVQVGPVEAGGHNLRGPEAQHLDDVRLYLSRGCGGKSTHHRPRRKLLQKFRDLQVTGPKILAPLGHAVCFIHRHQGNSSSSQGRQKGRRRQPLRGHIQQLVNPPPDSLKHLLIRLQVQGGVQISPRDSRLIEGSHLVGHQGDEGGDHQCHPLHGKRRNLVAHRLSRACGHHTQHIPSGEQPVNQSLLPGPERTVAEIPLQQFPWLQCLSPSPRPSASILAVS